jgi:energy-coupling factor transporter transmembrane protein EcfT
VHRLDVRMKLLLVVAYVFALFMVEGWPGLLLCAGLCVAAYLFSGIPFKLAFRGLKPILVLLVFTILANTVTFAAGPSVASPPVDAERIAEAVKAVGAAGPVREELEEGRTEAEGSDAEEEAERSERETDEPAAGTDEPAVTATDANAPTAAPATGADNGAASSGSPEAVALIGNFGVKPMGALRGLYFALRIVLLVSLTSLLTYTTSTVALSDGLVSLMRPLARVKVPTEDIATMFSIALRFIPITAEEAEKIMVAQSARGATFNKGGPIRRAKAWLPVMVPLFVSLFRRADELACAMETRCYVGKGRTHLRVAELVEIDFVIGIAGTLALILLGIVL